VVQAAQAVSRQSAAAALAPIGQPSRWCGISGCPCRVSSQGDHAWVLVPLTVAPHCPLITTSPFLGRTRTRPCLEGWGLMHTSCDDMRASCF
jgi:hypothetical protein